MKHTLSVLVENRFGVLARIAGLFSGRGYNIDSLTVGETHDPSISRMTIVVKGDDAILEQVNKQLNKLIDVIKVQDYSDKAYIETELVLVRIHATSKNRSEILQIIDIFKAKIMDVSDKSMMIEITGNSEKVNSFINMIQPYGIKEMARTGKVALGKG